MPDPSTNMVDAQNFALSMQTERGFQNGYGALGFEEARRVRDSAISDRDTLLRAAHTDEELAEGFGHVAERIADSAGALGVQAEKIGAATSLAIEKTGNQGRTDALTFANQAQVQALTFANAASQLATQNAYNALIDSTKNAAASALAIAVLSEKQAAGFEKLCCCVEKDGAATRDLISANRQRSLELQLLSVLPAARIGTSIP